MANHTLLDAVNQVLLKAAVIDTANTGLLASLTSSSIQLNIDNAIQVINEGIDDLYTQAEVELPLSMGSNTIILVNGQREYTLDTTLVELKWPLVDRTDIQYIFQWTGSYEDFLLFDPQQLYTGLPDQAMISPITGSLRLDRTPDSTVAGHTYTYQFMKDTGLVNATDNVPFNNRVFRAMVPTWFQLYNRRMRNDFDQGSYQISMGRASKALTEEPMKKNYSPRG